MRVSSAVALALVLAACGQAPRSPAAGFDSSQLSGWRAESFDDSEACAATNVRSQYIISRDGKRLLMKMDRKWKTGLGELDSVEATVLAASPRSLTIQYDGETRVDAAGKTVAWELVIVAPGLYRWRETSWESGKVNIVVGVRCSQ